MSDEHGVGRVVRWDVDDGTGAVVVDGVPAEIVVAADAVEAPAARGLQPGELVEIEYARAADSPYRAVRVCPTDSEP